MRGVFLAVMLGLFGAPALPADTHPMFDAALGAYEFFFSKCHGKHLVTPGTSSCERGRLDRLSRARCRGGLGASRAGETGSDFEVSQVLAEALDLRLVAEWLECTPGEESNPVPETDAMLAYGLCDIVPSHPLCIRATGTPSTDKGALPRWQGMPTEIDPGTQ